MLGHTFRPAASTGDLGKPLDNGGAGELDQGCQAMPGDGAEVWYPWKVSKLLPPPVTPLAVTWSSRGNLGEESWGEDKPAIVGC